MTAMMSLAPMLAPDASQYPMSEQGALESADRSSEEREQHGRGPWARVLTEVSFDGIIVVRRNRIVEVNQRAAEMFGYHADDVAGRRVIELIQIERSQANELPEPSYGHGIGIRGCGSTFPIEARWSSTADGLRVYVVRELAIARMAAEGESRSRELSETSNDLICEHDLDGAILSVNPAAARMLEFSFDELRTMTLRDILADETQVELADYLATIQRNGAAEGLMKVRTRGGAIRILHYRNVLVTGGVQGPVVHGLARDVSEREAALHTLRQSERRFRSIIENASDLIGIIDPVGCFQYLSPSTERLIGFAGEELIGRRVSEFVHAEDVARTIEFFEESASAGAPTRTIDFRVPQQDGSWRWLSVVATPVVRGGQVESIIINGRDITDRLLLEAQLEQANRLSSLGRLAATVAHEFNNVLMGIQPFADLMQRPGVPASTVARGARYIANSIVRGKRVALDILRYTHPAEPALQAVDLAEWWEHLVAEMEASLPDSITFTWSLPHGLPVLTDAAQLSQVFSNLISNARDAMPGGGKLEVTARRPKPGETYSFGLVPDPQKYLHLEVRDSGTGMSENVLLHAFEPLFTTKKNGGTGLGLAVAHQAVSRQGGHIFAESTVNVGTTFHVFIPAAATAPVAAAAETCLVQQPLTRTRVLLVDDEPYILEGLSQALCAQGMIVETAGTGREAICIARRFRPELAIIDIGLPDIDGLEVARGLRGEDPGLKIIFASGHGAAEATPVRDESTDFLQKPFEIEHLLAAMVALEQRRPS